MGFKFFRRASAFRAKPQTDVSKVNVTAQCFSGSDGGDETDLNKRAGVENTCGSRLSMVSSNGSAASRTSATQAPGAGR
ncbi:hypothetical protein MN608_01790 [Microdochium nivale]|nr:hypothetical protein MN608_01790 [Microdochium nivale]